jgi:hypothetical protein
MRRWVVEETVVDYRLVGKIERWQVVPTWRLDVSLRFW